MDVDPILAGLNPEQRRAVERVRGPVCILAGAGSGKTTTITRRIANQVATRAFRREQILAVTFTDKAVNPKTVMGQSKALCEWIVEAFGARDDVATRFVAVRFGNVLGSAGSVIPIFRRQIAKGGPLTVTHPEMTRFFMTIPESASLVIQAGAIGGRGDVFVLDMGEPVRIVDLARNMILLSGKEPERDIAIRFIGERAGEKSCSVTSSRSISKSGVSPWSTRMRRWQPVIAIWRQSSEPIEPPAPVTRTVSSAR